MPLSPEQEAHSIMVAHFLENSLYYGLFYHRWINPTVGPCLCANSLMLYLCGTPHVAWPRPLSRALLPSLDQPDSKPMPLCMHCDDLSCQPPLCCLVSVSEIA